MSLLRWFGIAGLLLAVGSTACTRRREAAPQATEPELTLEELNKTTLVVAAQRSHPPGNETKTEAARAVELFEQLRAAVLKKAVDASGLADGSAAREDDRATQMRLELALVEKGQRVFEDTVTLTATRQEKSYRATTGDTSRVFVVKYAFGRASSVEVEGPDYRAGFAFGIHRSTDWEPSVVGNDWATLLIKCTPLP